MSRFVLSQNKASARMVSDIWVNGTKLHVQYSNGSGKDMDMPPATTLRLSWWTGNWRDSTTGYVDVEKATSSEIIGTAHLHNSGASWTENWTVFTHY